MRRHQNPTGPEWIGVASVPLPSNMSESTKQMFRRSLRLNGTVLERKLPSKTYLIVLLALVDADYRFLTFVDGSIGSLLDG